MENSVSNLSSNIEGTGIIGKGNLLGNFAQVPMELFDYVQLGLITHTDLVVYVKLYDLYNDAYGYAFPTIPKLMVFTRIRSKSTIHQSLTNLEKVGLIRKQKGLGGNNIYLVYKPLDKSELYQCVPDRVEKFKEHEAKLLKTAELDKKRFNQHQLEKQLRIKKDPGMYSKRKEPKAWHLSEQDQQQLEEEAEKMIAEKLEKLKNWNKQSDSL